jgi:hypothetical protein
MNGINGTNGSTTKLFTRGGPGGPGRPKVSASNREYIDAIKAGYPPSRLLELMDLALALAVETRSWRGVVAVGEFAANYSLGKPVKRVETTGDSSLADLLANVDTSRPLLGDDDEEEEG